MSEVKANSDKQISNKRTIKGIVKSDKMDKTIVVQSIRKERHTLYNKVIQRYGKYKAHDEKNVAKTGDNVVIKESRPLSKDKRWVLVKVVS